MERNKKIYIFLLLISLILIIYSAFLLNSQSELNQAQSSILVKDGNNYILRYDIKNNEPIDRNYKISVTIGEKRYDEEIFLVSGGVFTYKHHFYPPLENKSFSISVYKENELLPLSKDVYVFD